MVHLRFRAERYSLGLLKATPSMRQCLRLVKSREWCIRDLQKTLERSTCFSLQPTMNQTDIKFVLVIFVGVLSTLCVETSQEKCPDCPEGWYFTKNCSERAGVYFWDCSKCRRCEETGQITVSKCTRFANTQCADADQPVTTMVTTHTTLPPIGQPRQITLYGCSFVVVAVFMLAVIMSICFIRISKSGESDESSAGEPFNIKDTETV